MHACIKPAKAFTIPKSWKKLCTVPADKNGHGHGFLLIVPTEELLEMRPYWNPRERTDPDAPSSRLAGMRKSVANFGLGQFPVINRREVLDGNRRVAAAYLEGLDRIPVYFRPDATAEMYAELNANQKQHTPCERSETGMKNPAAATVATIRNLNRAQRVLGKRIVRSVTLRHRMNVTSLLGWANRAYRYVQPTGSYQKFVRLVVLYQANKNATRALRNWIEFDRGRQELFARIVENLPLSQYGD
jgi:hypothetical protein